MIALQDPQLRRVLFVLWIAAALFGPSLLLGG